MERLTRQMVVELKPCPFCGGEAAVRYEVPYRSENKSLPCIACSNCKGVMGYFRDKAEAIEAWNRRKEANDDAGTA